MFVYLLNPFGGRINTFGGAFFRGLRKKRIVPNLSNERCVIESASGSGRSKISAMCEPILAATTTHSLIFGKKVLKICPEWTIIDYTKRKCLKWVASPQALVFCFHYCISTVIGGGAPKSTRIQR